ncbi:MAG TPA: Bax inhibitor-1/YccA family protein [Cyclobacteriaceae bacterium]
MTIGRTANPALNSKTFSGPVIRNNEQAMSIQGTVNKTFLMLVLLLLTATYTWSQFMAGSSTGIFMAGGGIGGLVVAIITVFKKEWSGITAPVYALLEGLFLGALSAYFETMFPGIVVQAVALTFGTLFSLLAAYKSGLIKVTENFKLGVAAATGGIAMIYLANFVIGFFGINLPFIHEGGTFGILFSLGVVIVAALNLVLDFDFIESRAESGAPKYMEWYAAFGLMVTLIWLYIEILRLLSKLRSR